MSADWCSHGLDERQLGELSWVTLDLETTGLEPGRHTIREYASYSVSPAGDVAMLAAWHDATDGADRFLEGLDEIAKQVRAGDVLVAHNIVFDLAFLAVLPSAPVELVRPPLWLCTMRMLSEPRRLEHLAGRLGVVHETPHTAAGDARALADTLATVLTEAATSQIGEVGHMADYADARCVARTRRGGPHANRAAGGWVGLRRTLDHVVPISTVTNQQRATFDAAARLLADASSGPMHPVESAALASALRGVAITASALDILVREMQQPRSIVSDT